MTQTPIAAALSAGRITSICGRLDRLHRQLRPTVGAMTKRERTAWLTARGWERPDVWRDPITGDPHVQSVAIRVALLRSWGVS